MEHLAPSLSFVRQVLHAYEGGSPLNQVLDRLSRSPRDLFAKRLSVWWRLRQSGGQASVHWATAYQLTFLEILDLGLKGAPIYEHLKQLEHEMSDEFDQLWKSYLESLPGRLSIPLLLFFFPSYLVLLFGPLISQLSRSLS